MTATGVLNHFSILESTVELEFHDLTRAGKAVRGAEYDHERVGLVVRTGTATLRRIRELSAAPDSQTSYRGRDP